MKVLAVLVLMMLFSCKNDSKNDKSDDSNQKDEKEESEGTSDDQGDESGGTPKPYDDQLIPSGDYTGGGTYSLIYPKDWTPGYESVRTSDNEKLFLQDFSYAGYKNGEELIPTPDVSVTFSGKNDGSVDVSAELQKAIDDLGATGGGVLFIPEGLYKLNSGITISKSNIIIRGAGQGKTKLFFENVSTAAIKAYPGYAKYVDEDEDNEQYSLVSGWELTSDAKLFDQYVQVENSAGLQAGDDIFISWQITQAFKDEHKSGSFWYHVDLGDYAEFFRRTITKVEGNKIFFKVPLRYDINDTRDHAKIRKLTDWRAYLSGVGLESFSISNATGDLDKNWNDGKNQEEAISLDGCRDCWVRSIDSFASYENHDYHVRSHGIVIVNSMRVTVDNCVMQKAEHLGSGGNGYLFQIVRSNEILVKNSTAIKGRHNFSINWDFGSSGNVFFNVKSSGGRVCDTLNQLKTNTCNDGDMDLHHSLHIANLFDNVEMDDAISILNRQDWSQGAGMTGTQNVIWHTTGTGKINSYNFKMGYVIGSDASTTVNTSPDVNEWGFPGWDKTHNSNNDFYFSEDTAPDDYVELIGEVDKLSPKSLYVDQLKRRLGK